MTVSHLHIHKRFTAFVNMAFGSSNMVVTIIIGIVLVPMYLRFFSAATYGAWLASAGVISMVTLLESGLSTVLTQKLAAAYSRRDYDAYAQIAGSGLVISVALAIIIIMAGILLTPFLVDWVKTPEDQRLALRNAVMLTSIGAGVATVSYSLGSIPMSLQRTVVMGMVSVGGNIVSVVAVISGLFLGMGVMALSFRNLSNFLIYLLGYAIYIIIIWKKLRLPFPAFDKRAAWLLAKDSSALFVSNVSSAIANRIEAPVAAMAISPEASAVLVLTGKIVKVIEMFVAMVGSSVFAGVAHLSEALNLDAKREAVSEIIIVFKILLGCGLGMAIAFSKPICFLWIGKDLFGGFALVLLIAFFTLFSAMTNFIASFAVGFGQVRPASICLGGRAFLNIAFLAALVFPMGIYGIPLAGALSSVVAVIFLALIVGKSPGLTTRVIYLPGTKGFLLSLSVGLSWAWLVPIPETWLFLALQGIFCLVFILAVSLLIDRQWTEVVRKNSLMVLESIGNKWPNLKLFVFAVNYLRGKAG